MIGPGIATAICHAEEISRSQVYDLERAQLSMPQALDQMTLTVHKAHRTQSRTWGIPANCRMTGAIQKYDCINVLSQGTIHVLTAKGIMETVSAPWIEVTPAGTKRVGQTITDCVWTTIYGTDLDQMDDVVGEFTTNDEQVYLAHAAAQLKLEGE